MYSQRLDLQGFDTWQVYGAVQQVAPVHPVSVHV